MPQYNGMPRLEKAWLYSSGPMPKKKKRKAKTKAKGQQKAALGQYRRELIDRATPAETLFREFLSRRGFSCEFQKIFMAGGQGYIVDFYLNDYHIAVEIDGGYHNTEKQRMKDATRSKALSRLGQISKIIRFTNEEVASGEQSFFMQRLFPETNPRATLLRKAADTEADDSGSNTVIRLHGG